MYPEHCLPIILRGPLYGNFRAIPKNVKKILNALFPGVHVGCEGERNESYEGFPMGFEVWMNKVDEALGEKCGLSHNDLADQTWYDWYNSGMEPAEAAAECLANEGFPGMDEADDDFDFDLAEEVWE